MIDIMYLYWTSDWVSESELSVGEQPVFRSQLNANELS